MRANRRARALANTMAPVGVGGRDRNRVVRSRAHDPPWPDIAR